MIIVMIHEAYMPVYMGSRFLARTDGTGRTEVVQEALADLKINKKLHWHGGAGGGFHDSDKRPIHVEMVRTKCQPNNWHRQNANHSVMPFCPTTINMV